ncbi:MAG: hypothetical protein P1U50_11925 [Parvibaculaceae bacterium]|nr:hypothetical protein [Parvibaculaceae bacterium]
MKDVIWNAVSFVAVVALAIAYETGAVAAGNAFFGLFAVLVLYTAKQLLTHENEQVSDAIKGLFMRPQSHGTTASYVSYLGMTALGSVVMAQMVLVS